MPFLEVLFLRACFAFWPRWPCFLVAVQCSLFCWTSFRLEKACPRPPLCLPYLLALVFRWKVVFLIAALLPGPFFPFLGRALKSCSLISSSFPLLSSQSASPVKGMNSPKMTAQCRSISKSQLGSAPLGGHLIPPAFPPAAMEKSVSVGAISVCVAVALFA